ncbi:hypothetical protein PRK78_001410 [Emydomyces testavorans]|uniref:Uncharacterized protein n=1 Tax=Emydomyces testavorans TaxID=2070801 RepID=A0AAF0IFH2_9EURO|nr:hypothetical protein PRK78_001410 [Emydomyces testavorans]
MVNIDDNFLTPRELLQGDEFCFRQDSIYALLQFIRTGMSVPTSRNELIERSRFPSWLFTWHTPREIIGTADNIVIEFCNARANTQTLRSVLQVLPERCSCMLNLAENAHNDYGMEAPAAAWDFQAEHFPDTIFKLLQDIHDGRGDVVDLQQQVKLLIEKHLRDIDALIRDIKQDNQDITNVVQRNDEIKIDLLGLYKQFEREVNNWEIAQVWGEPSLLSGLYGIISTITDQPELAVTDLQLMIGVYPLVRNGGWDAISNDLEALETFVRNNTKPEIKLILELEKKKILHKWESLKREVERFQQEYAIAAGAS